jgi:hypothetical protein
MADVALAYPVYQPAMRIVTSITNTYPAIVETGELTFPGWVITVTPFDHLYVDGMIIRLRVPYYYGMTQIDGLYGKIMRIDASHFSIDIDATHFDPFVIPPIITIPDPHADPLVYPLPVGLPMPLPPYKRLTLWYTDPVTGVRTALMPSPANPMDIEEYAECVPFAEDNAMLTAAVRNVLPY